jgi:anti-anti-sigma regulatory factor
MSVEQYSSEIIVVAAPEGPAPFKIWLREEGPADLTSDLRWLCEEYMDSHVVVDLADVVSLRDVSYRLILDLQEEVQESNFRFVLCGLSPHLKWQLRCIRLFDRFETFDTREAALRELSPEGRD